MNEMAAAISIRPTCGLLYRTPHRPNWARRVQAVHGAQDRKGPRLGPILHRRSRLASAAASRADDSAPFEMSVENALKLLGVAEGASFDDILRAKNSIVASCKDDQEAVAQVSYRAHPPPPTSPFFFCFRLNVEMGFLVLMGLGSVCGVLVRNLCVLIWVLVPSF